MKIIEKTDSGLVLRAVPWVSYALHGILGLGFLAGFVVSAWTGSSLLLTLGFAGCLAFIVRVCAFHLEVVTAQFDRPADKITLTRQNGRGRMTQTHALSSISGFDAGFEQDGDAVSVIIHFADGSTAELPASSNGFVTTVSQVEKLHHLIQEWVNG